MNALLVRRCAGVLLTAVFLLSAVMTGTLSWAGFHQSALNEAKGEQGLFPAELVKYEKTADGAPTGQLLPGAEFYLYRVSDPDDVQIGGRYVTDGVGRIQVNLPRGSYYFEETNPGSGHTYDQTEEGGGQPTVVRRYPFAVPGADAEAVVVTACNRRVEGSLIIEKTVRNEDGAALTEDRRDAGFTFSVTLDHIENGTVEAVVAGVKQQLTIAGHRLSLVLKHGEKAVFENIPTGVRYTVAEIPVAGYVTSAVNSSGNIPEGGITAGFVNTIPAGPPETGALTVTKEVTGASPDPDREFLFTAVFDGVPEDFTLKHGESRTFPDLPVGTDYTVTEADAGADGYIAAVRAYAGAIMGADSVVTLPFVNVRDDGQDQNGSFEISKSAVGAGADLERAFEFTVAFAGENLPDPVLCSVNGGEPFPLPPDGGLTLKSGETARFGNLPAGTVYTVAETAAAGYFPNFSAAEGVIAGGRTAVAAYVNTKIPAPEEGGIFIRKEGAGEAFDPEKAFAFTVTVGNLPYEPYPVTVNGQEIQLSADNAQFSIPLKAGQTGGPIRLPVGASYSVVEENAADEGYLQTGLVGGSGTVTLAPITVTQTNTCTNIPAIDVSGEKTWSDGDGQPADADLLPADVTLKLKNGDLTAAIVTVGPDEHGKWNYVFENVPKYEADGVTEIRYTVEEVPVAGWSPAYDGFNVTNTYLPPVAVSGIPVKKTITGAAPKTAARFEFLLTALDGAPLPEGSANGAKRVAVNGAGNADFGKIVYAAPGAYVYTISEVNTNAVGYTYDGTVYTYTVVAAEQDGKMAIVSKTLVKNGAPAETAVFTNYHAPDFTAVGVKKVWLDDGSHPQSVTVRLYGNGVPYGAPVVLNPANGWAHVWGNLDKNAKWTVDETGVPDGYAKTIGGDSTNGFIITNTKGDAGDDKTTVEIRNVWIDEDHPQSVTVQLYRDDMPYGDPVVLNESNNWIYIWTNLDKDHIYTIKEIDVPDGFTQLITGDAETGFTLTKIKGDVPPAGKVAIRGIKTWRHGGNDPAKRPKAITVIVRANGNVIIQKQITGADHWYYSFVSDQYDAEGREIVYTVDEAKIPGYDKTADGYNLINTYNPAGPDGARGARGSKNPPQTGDDNRLAFWTVLMCVSFAGIVALAFAGRRGKKQRYIPLH
ncbi:MAG: Cna B-type domain-containing protein [Clostridiales Family XIII bacterium]|nr:Cna B-type domain-containing protein [Clostridiales Family XIII bacterium]